MIPLTVDRRVFGAFAVLLAAVGCQPDRKSTTPATRPTPQPNKAEPDEQPLRLLDRTFDDIKFDIEPDGDFDRSMLTDAIRDLDGRRIRIRGWMLPSFRTKGLKEFVLVRDNQECCFGPGAALYDCILITMQPGKTANYTIRSVAVEGEFRVEEFYGPDERPLAIYQLQGEAVE